MLFKYKNMMARFFILLIIYLGCYGCTQKITLSKMYQPKYAKYWEKYTWQQVKDVTYQDTLKINFRTSEGNLDNDTRGFYLKKISLLLTDLKDDWGKADSLYPQAAFDAVKVTQLGKSLFKKVRYMNQSQVNALLEILNNPLHFDWSETTFEADLKVDFLQNENVMASFQLQGDYAVVKLLDNQSTFKKMKFGSLKEKPRSKLIKLFNDLGFRTPSPK